MKTPSSLKAEGKYLVGGKNVWAFIVHWLEELLPSGRTSAMIGKASEAQQIKVVGAWNPPNHAYNARERPN
jgi:hypothetical protein